MNQSYQHTQYSQAMRITDYKLQMCFQNPVKRLRQSV